MKVTRNCAICQKFKVVETDAHTRTFPSDFDAVLQRKTL